MNGQYTPGPWRVTGDGYIAGRGFVPIRTPFREDAFRGENRSDHPEEELQANARLIAAAPELVARLIDHVRNDAGIIGATCPACGRDNSEYGNVCTSDDCMGVSDRAALEKAGVSV